ncbi:hypothetical protein [Oceanivirga miroungae]|uniref:Uncharacterized protein n=1 Tax=Oceanivirga miroungae TaxID=1130046 RepID=A0A6I8M695_9FUSO|nr:hypothetical protein [Oceanivirga miroungae]VWL84954.1 hypothetical protein OMES3154_00226 [Oceanivirga miroungae]
MEYELISTVINMSNNKEWYLAVHEWNIIGFYDDEECESECVCGKKGIRYLYKIVNRYNKNILYPIGSSCIRKFAREDMNEDISLYEQLLRLTSEYSRTGKVLLDSEFFSRRLINYFYDKGCFGNNDNAEKNRDFLINMFNKRNQPTENQEKYIWSLLNKNIKPYLDKVIKENKVRKNN